MAVWIVYGFGGGAIMKWPFVLRSTMDKKVNETCKFFSEGTLKNLSDLSDLQAEKAYLQERLTDQKWYRTRWDELIIDQNNSMREIAETLKTLVKNHE